MLCHQIPSFDLGYLMLWYDSVLNVSTQMKTNYDVLCDLEEHNVAGAGMALNHLAECHESTHRLHRRRWSMGCERKEKILGKVKRWRVGVGRVGAVRDECLKHTSLKRDTCVKGSHGF